MSAGAVQEVSGGAREILSLAEEIGAGPVRVEALEGPDSPRLVPSAFRVSFADGRRMKAHWLGSPQRAARVERLLGLIDQPAFPAVIARRGRVLVLEWIDGERAAEDGPAAAKVRLTAAALQARVHDTRVPADLDQRPAEVIAELTAKLRDGVAALAAAGIVTADEARTIYDLTARFAPIACRVGIVHRDFCVGNLVVRPNGAIGVIDNETLTVGACEFDLARTWYRWPLPPHGREEYWGAYARAGEMDSLLRHFPFWALTTLVDSARMRLPAASAVRAVPVERLRAFLATLCDGADPESLAFTS